MNRKIFEAFDVREKKVNKYMAGCGQRYGGDCTCGMDCECESCPVHPKANKKATNNAFRSSVPEVKSQKSGGCCGGGTIAGKGKGGNLNNVIKRDTYGRQSTASGFGRALSALSALSIDWENMDDFDVEVDHSAHIDNSDMRQPQKVSEKEAELIYEVRIHSMI